jgi:LruC domain-containing protein
MNPALIQSVTGYNHTDGIVTVNSKGLEVGHSDGATIIVFDDAFNNAGQLVGGSFVNTQANQPEIIAPEMEITIEFINPIDPAVINSVPPYNPFIFIDGDRGRELHLADKTPTDLADPIFFGTVHDMTNPSNGVYYRTANNLPWGINMIHEFRHPLEKIPINTAYNFFSTWGVSGGNSYKDWYKDNAGYRNTNKLYLK